eukprot:g18924.t1
MSAFTVATSCWELSADLMLHRMRAALLKPNVISLNSRVVGMMWNISRSFALLCLEAMDISEVRANVISQNNVLHACRRTDQWPHYLGRLACTEWTPTQHRPTEAHGLGPPKKMPCLYL